MGYSYLTLGRATRVLTFRVEGKGADVPAQKVGGNESSAGRANAVARFRETRSSNLPPLLQHRAGQSSSEGRKNYFAPAGGAVAGAAAGWAVGLGRVGSSGSWMMRNCRTLVYWPTIGQGAP